MMCILLELVIVPKTLRVAVAIAAPALSDKPNRFQAIATSFRVDLFCVVGLVGNIIAKNAELPSLSLDSFSDILILL